MKGPNKLEHLSPASPSSLVYHLQVRLEFNQAGLAQACFIVLTPCLAYKYFTRLESLAKDKHSSLLLKSVNYGRK